LLVEDERVLRTGDHLRIGRLEFEVAIGESTPGPSPERTADGTSASDAVAEELCDILDEADERARLLRLEHPEWRQLHLELAATDAAKTPASAAEAQSHSAQGTGATKVKTAPGKLPARPPTADSQGKDSSEAAQQALRKLFSR
jgi:predicted component of type VI protein secretion system